MNERQIGQYLLALPFLVYGVEHFIYADFVATIVPSWIPWHFFWVYFAGIAIFATGVSLVTGRLTALATTLAGAMILSWVFLIHLPFLYHALVPSWDSSLLPPLDRPLSPTEPGLDGRLANCFMDLGISGSLFVCAGSLALNARLLAFGRVLLGIAIWSFGVIHFAFPVLAPGIPPMKENITFPIPGHLFWVYLTGAAFVAGGVCLIINRQTHLAATWLSGIILVCVLLVWVPIIIAKPIQLTGNWLKHLGDLAGLLMLAAVSDPGRSPVGQAAAAPPPHGGQKSPAGLG
jgi:uncharacterized membrane protein